MREDGRRSHYDSREESNVSSTVVEWEDGVEEARLSTDLVVESWSYDGLITLKSGDELTIYEKFMPSKIAWQGLVNLLAHDEENSEHLEHPFRLHHDQKGVDQNEWAGWFLNEYPAKLFRPDGFWSLQRIQGPFLPVPRRIQS